MPRAPDPQGSGASGCRDTAPGATSRKNRMKTPTETDAPSVAATRIASLIVPALDNKGRKGTIPTEWGRKTRVGVAAMIDGELEKERANAATLLAALLSLVNVATHPQSTKAEIRWIAKEARFTIAAATGAES